MVALGYGKFVRADRVFALVPLEVPAGCELVLEGELDVDATVDEGPVSEFHGGYERYGSAATATFQRLTRRRDALYQAMLDIRGFDMPEASRQALESVRRFDWDDIATTTIQAYRA